MAPPWPESNRRYTDCYSQFVLTTLNTSKSAYASFRFATNKFFSRYHYQGGGQFREKLYCNLYIKVYRNP